MSENSRSAPHSASNGGAIADETMSKADYVKLARFRYSIRQFLAFSQRNAEAYGLTPHQHQALLSIRSFPDRDAVTIGELAQHLCIRQNSAVELVDRLETLELVQRQTHPDDRRQVLVTLTRKAKSVLASLSATNLEEIRRLAPSFASLILSLTAEPKPAAKPRRAAQTSGERLS